MIKIAYCCRRGLCSTWISQLSAGDLVPVKTRKGTLTFPPAPVPIVMVGPGTGVAPFRSFLTENLSSERQTMLYFGCRNKAVDFFFEKDFSELKNLQLVTAFSRDQEDKIYVQHRMKETSERLSRYFIFIFCILKLSIIDYPKFISIVFIMLSLLSMHKSPNNLLFQFNP